MQYKIPHFLNFYSTSSIRAKIINSAIKLAFFLGQSHRVKSGVLHLQITETSLLGKILQKYEYTGFSIYTGTIDENRKAIIELHDNQSTFVFLKVALNEISSVLVRNEIVQLTYLNNFNFNTLVIPRIICSSDDGIIEFTNIKPYKYHQSSKLTTLHVNALLELYSQSYSQTTWKELRSLHECVQKTNKLLENYNVVNSLEIKRVHKLYQQVLLLSELIINDKTSLPVSITHGDFTPWNMYNSYDTLHLFDWELGQTKIPMTVDLIHFVFQSEIMINHTGYKVIRIVLDDVLELQNIQALINDFDIDFNKHYVFYLIHTISYYLNKYVKQNDLHKQAFWLINSWEDAVDDLINNNGVVFR